MYRGKLFLLLFTFFCGAKVYSQECTMLGQKPGTAFPVCGKDVFFQPLLWRKIVIIYLN